MRKLFLGVATVAILAYGGSAFAQSQQGGYLGLNPGGHQSAGAKLAPGNAIDDDPQTAAMAWCRKSPEPSRCRGHAIEDHKQCMAENPDHYESCRFAFDRMFFK
jgi:hypothetical protein